MCQRAFQAIFITLAAVAAFSFLPPSSSTAAGWHSVNLEEGLSTAEACESQVEVCGVMSGDRLREFSDRCAAQEAGAEQVLVGPCFDAN